MLIRDRIKELRRVPAKELVPNAKNWRRHPDAQQKAMAAVLSEVGYADALLAREDENGMLVLIDGHLRAGTTPNQEVPVLVLDVTAAEADKILATLDPLAGMAEVDTQAWGSLIDGLEVGTDSFADLLDQLRPQAALFGGNTDEDEVPEVPENPVTRPGDIWALGKHRIRCGDSTDVQGVAALFDGVEPGLMVTDPPYGVEYDPEWRAKAGINKNRGKMGKVANDDRIDWAAAYSLFPGQVVYVWHAGKFAGAVAESLEASGFEIVSQIIWAKDRFALSRGDYHWQHEPCWYAVRKGSKHSWVGGRSQTTLWNIPRADDSGHGHGTQKPVECMRRPIINHTNIGQAIYDPFVGSGTSLIAAETTGRICYAADLEPAYVDVAVKRWQAFTGQTATSVRTGEPFPADPQKVTP